MVFAQLIGEESIYKRLNVNVNTILDKYVLTILTKYTDDLLLDVTNINIEPIFLSVYMREQFKLLLIHVICPLTDSTAAR